VVWGLFDNLLCHRRNAENPKNAARLNKRNRRK